MFRRARRVRIHTIRGEQDGTTYEGLQHRRRPVGGHYQLTHVSIIRGQDESVQLDHPMEIPAGKVVAVEVLGR